MRFRGFVGAAIIGATLSVATAASAAVVPLNFDETWAVSGTTLGNGDLATYAGIVGDPGGAGAASVFLEFRVQADGTIAFANGEENVQNPPDLDFTTVTLTNVTNAALPPVVNDPIVISTEPGEPHDDFHGSWSGLLHDNTYRLTISYNINGATGGSEALTGSISFIPLPPAALLLGSVLLGGGMLARRRRRKDNVAAA